MHKKIRKIYRFLLYVAPIMLMFSYLPVISLGGNESMNFELSIALLWLVFFDFFAGWLFWLNMRDLRLKNGENKGQNRKNGGKEAKNRRKFEKNGENGIKVGFLRFWRENLWWFVVPLYAVLSLLWTGNLTRGVLTAGLLSLVDFAAFMVVKLRGGLPEGFWRKFAKIVILSGVGMGVVLVIQCILDLVGVSAEVTGMCKGCITEMFGFPHPNGFAIEPQFMGNLLIAPALLSVFAVYHGEVFSQDKVLGKGWVRVLVSIFVISVLFLTFSRGAIYAFIVGSLFYIFYEVFRARKWGKLFGFLIILAGFVLTLNFQGVMAEVSWTDDTYFTGVGKVVEQMTLGVVKMGGGDIDVGEGSDNVGGGGSGAGEVGFGGDEADDGADTETGEKTDDTDSGTGEKAVYSGYVAESTNVRVGLSNSALKVFRRDFLTMFFGVGIGGAGEALYAAGETGTAKEIVQNEYVSLLLELGIIGVGVIAVFAGWIGLKLKKSLKNTKSEDGLVGMAVIFGIIVAYMVSVCFFSGLANALHIYVLPVIMIVGVLEGAEVREAKI